MKQFLYQSEWLGLDQDLRDKLKEVFSINRSEGMSVVNGKLTSDGCSQNDLTAGITIGKMIDYTGDLKLTIVTDENNEKLFDELFKIVVAKVSGKLKAVKFSIGVVKDMKELNSNIKKDEETNKGTESKSKGAKTESKGDKQTTGKGDDKPSGDDSVNAGSGDRQDIQRSKATNKSKRAGHSSRKGAEKSKKAR